MRKIVGLCILYTLCLVNYNSSYGQTTDPISIEKVTPTTPEGAALGKYAAFPVGLFTGTPNVNIDMYNLRAKHLELPISLNYSSNGLRVDEMPTKVGMSWTLLAGGAITRTVYDKADDAYTRANFPYTDAQLSSTTGTDLNVPAWLEQIDFAHYDTQFDEYSFNFNGHTGKFIIDLNNNPVLIPYSNLKIELNPFRITTADGLKYYFEAGEGPSYSSSGGCSRDNSHPFNSVWYLTKIVDLNDPSDVITISYVNGGYTYHPQINQTITYFDATNPCAGVGGAINDPNNPCGCQTPCIYGGPGSPNLTVDNFCSNTESVNVAYISEITSSLYGKVKFLYNTSYGTSSTPIPIDRLLTGIQVYQNSDGTNLLKSYNLIYTFVKPSSAGKIYSTDNIATENPDVNSYRPFLTSIQELDNAGSVVKTHTLEYNDFNNLTARLSSSQDYWGYYNGKVNTTSLIPDNGGGPLPVIKTADRNPDYNYAVKGMLQKVTFPTGGNVTFKYEGNTKRTQPLAAAPPNYTIVTSVQASNTSPSATFYVLTPTTVTVRRSYYCCNGGTNTCAIASNTRVWGQVNSVLNNTAVTLSSYNFGEYNRRGECSNWYDETFTLQPGAYGLYVSGFDNYALSLTATAVSPGHIYMLNMAPTMTALATDGGGVRVQQQIAFDPVANKTITTNYQYDGMVIPYTPQYRTTISYRSQRHEWVDGKAGTTCITGVTPCAELKECRYFQYSSNSTINTNGRGGNPVYYTSVTESVGDNFVDGGTEHIYSWFADADLNHIRGNIIPNASTPSSSWKNGLELNRNVFKMVNGSKVYISKIANTYTDDPRINNVYTQYITKRSGLSETIAPSLPSCTATSVFNLRMNVFDVLSYSTNQKWTYLSSSQETDYDMNGNNPITKTVNYYYDNPSTAMLTRVETVNSKGQVIKSINKYPGDEASVTNLTTSESDAITKLKAQNSYSVTLETEKYVNNTLQQRLHFGYKDWGSGILKPESIKNQLQANPIESRVQFMAYDVNGNLLQQAKVGDAYKSYIWDYKAAYPVAEATNASQTDIAYTSFDADGKGSWVFTGTAAADATAVTGGNSYNLAQTSGTITRAGLTSATTYTVSYWSNTAAALTIAGTISGYPILGRSVNGWYYHEHKITGVTSLSIAGSCKIDELRLYPSSAQMTTYTYTPLVGMSSQCDINNRITYYVYDALQRLTAIKDQDGNVVKKICYSYAGQTTACPN